MTSIGSTGGNPPTAPRPAPAARRAAHPDDVHAMNGALAKVSPGQGRPLPRGKREELETAKRQPPRNGTRGEDVEQRATSLQARGDDRRTLDDETDHRGGDHDGQPALATAPLPVAAIAVPDMPGPHVDPAVFAQLMTQLWLRERSKGTREVRVSFGADAWPAAGARMVRNAAGTLDIQLHLAQPGADDGAMLDGLARHLSGNGLAVGALQLTDDV